MLGPTRSAVDDRRPSGAPRRPNRSRVSKQLDEGQSFAGEQRQHPDVEANQIRGTAQSHIVAEDPDFKGLAGPIDAQQPDIWCTFRRRGADACRQD